MTIDGKSIKSSLRRLYSLTLSPLSGGAAKYAGADILTVAHRMVLAHGDGDAGFRCCVNHGTADRSEDQQPTQ